MGFIKKYISGKEYKWFWYVSTIIGGALPILISAVLNFASPNFDWLCFYKMADMAFLGLAMNISNLNLIGSRTFKEKETLVIITFGLMIFLSISLGFVYSMPQLPTAFSIVIHGLVLGSIYFSFETNNFVFEERIL